MSITIVNLTTRPVFLAFNSGKTVHLGPKQKLEDIHISEVQDNRKIDTLVERGVIELQEAEATIQSPEEVKL